MVDLEVAFLSSRGTEPYHDPGFGVTVAVTGVLAAPDGPCYHVAAVAKEAVRRERRARAAGHSGAPRSRRSGRLPQLWRAACCTFLTCSAAIHIQSPPPLAGAGWRNLLATFVVRSAAGALPIGRLMPLFMTATGAYAVHRALQRRQRPIPHHVRRCQAVPDATAGITGLDPQRPTVIFSGKLVPQKRPWMRYTPLRTPAGHSTW